MNRVAKAATRPPGEMSADLLKTIHWSLLVLFLLNAVWAGAAVLFPAQIPGADGTAEAMLVLSATVLTLVSQSRRLPGQNVLLAAAIIVVISSIAHAAGARTGIPFGLFTYTGTTGPVLFNMLAWFVPFLWVIILFNSRGVARLIVRPWRRTRRYGLWIIALTTVLAVVFDFGMEPFATRVDEYWFWLPSKIPVDWFGAPISNFVGWLVVTLIILGFATPSLMNKRPSGSPPDYSPLLIWVMLNALFILGAVSKQLWPAAIFAGVACVLVTGLAVHGARW
jgi:uncharacterized membrane protein